MLKKAGIVVAAAAAALLAVSPLAFAGEGGWGHGHDEVNSVEQGHSNIGLVNVADNEVNVPVQACDNNVNVLGVQVPDVTAALGVLGAGEASNSTSCAQENQSGGNVFQNID